MKGMNRVKRGRGFRGVLNYIFGRDAEHKTSPGVLLGGNMSGHDPQSLAQEFGVTRQLRPDIAKPVWHNSLRLPAAESLSHDEWIKIADAYMEKMGFGPLHPRCYVLHDDKEGQHIHIAASRIALDGSLYLGKNENLASTRIIQQLEIEHGLTITKGPEYENGKIKMPKVKNPSKSELEMGLRLEVKPPRLVLQGWLDAAIQKPKTVIQFVQFLEGKGVYVTPNLAETGRLNGFAFALDDVKFKGSSLGDGYKWARLSEVVSYDQNRDFEELAKRKPVVGNDGRNSGSLGSVAGKNGRPDSAGAGASGPAGQDAGPAPIDHPAVDRSGDQADAEADRWVSPRPSTAVSADGAGAASEVAGRRSVGERLEEQGRRVVDAGRGAEGAVRESTKSTEAVDDVNYRAGRNPDRDSHEMAGDVMAWNSRFKQASARKHGKSPNERQDVDRKAEFERLRETAHMADLVVYMQTAGLDVKKDGVKDWVIDGQYRITRKPDNHYVWCSWDQSRGGDAIDFCTDELGSSFQQALADLGGGRFSPVTKPHGISHVDRFPTSPPVSRDPDAVLKYLEGRGISRSTIRHAQGAGFLRFVDYAGTPGVAFCGYDSAHHLRSMAVRLLRPVRSWDGQKEITKIDVKHSDKSYPAIYRGGDPILPSDRSLWIVEGGTDGLAALDWYRAAKIAAPGIIVSGGDGVRAFLDRPHVQSLLKNAATIYVALEREKDQETQIRTDAAHQRQIQKIQGLGLGCEFVAWRPPVGSKDVADAWKAGALPDAHDPLAHMRQGGGGGSAPMPTSAPTSTSTFGPE